MSNDFGKTLDEQGRRRARALYIRKHAPLLHAALLTRVGEEGYAAHGRGAAVDAVAAAGQLFDALPPDPDQEQGSGAPAQLLPVEPEATARAVLPACTCTGQQPCSAECRRCVPERRQSAGPEEATHAERAPRRPVSERLARLADCQNTTDPAAIAAYHAHLASSGLKDCGACGLVFDAGAPNPGRPFDASTAELEALVRYVANAPIQEDAATQRAHVLTEDLECWAASKGAEVLP